MRVFSLAASGGSKSSSSSSWDWWAEINESAQWQDGIFFFLFAAYGLVSAVSLVETCNVGLTGSGSPNFIGCLPCSHSYLTASYFDNHNGLLDSDFHDFLTQNIGTDDLCKGRVDHINVIGFSDMNRYLIGEGSHRHLISQMRFDRQPNELKWLDDLLCETIIIERLPIGVFADPFELQHLVERKVFSGAAVFGDTNLELPSALSNRSIVEIHMDARIASKSSKTVVQLPLHARYPPLNASGYAQVAIGKPDLFLRCRQNDLRSETCSWAICNVDAETTNSVVWRIPCGNGAHTGTVSSVTFVSALVCSLSIVSTAICFFRKDDIKRS